MLSTEDEFIDYHITTEQLACSLQNHGGGSYDAFVSECAQNFTDYSFQHFPKIIHAYV